MKNVFKLCLIAPVPPPYGGIGNWVLLLKKYIASRDDITIDIVSTAPKARSIDGRSLFDRVVLQGLLIFKKCNELKKVIKNNRPDVIHMTTSGQLAVVRDIALLRAAGKAGVPVVYHIRFGRIKEIAEKKTIEWKLISRAMQLATEVMVIDRTTYETVRKYLPSVNVVYVPNPIDISNMPKPESNCNKVVLFLGWVVKTKGIEELLKAWENVVKSHDDWQLKLIGPCNDGYLDYLKANYSFVNVVYEGEKSHNEAMDLLNESGIFILPSYTEGFPNVVLEAMALAKPIIATRVGAIPDMLSDDCGVLVNVKDVNEISESLMELISNIERRNDLSANAYKKLQAEYTIKTVFDQYLKEWHGIKL